MTCPFPGTIENPKPYGDRLIAVPCGYCYACKENRRNDWIIRLSEEMKQHDYAVFITLTYDNDNVPLSDYGPSLYKRDIQNYIKRLRKSISPLKIRYYAVGEYGSKTMRPHYHAIIFGINAQRIELINSWNSGHVQVGDVNERSIRYVTKYHVNAVKKPDGLEPEFALMSRKPGIGANYLDRTKEYHSGDVNKAFYSHFGKKRRLPRFYKDRLYTEPEKAQIKEIIINKDFTGKARELWMKKNPGKNYFEYLRSKHKKKDRLFKDKNKRIDKL